MWRRLLSLPALLILACAAPDERPNIVVAVADDWSWPYAGAYGDLASPTPTFDLLARSGTLFERAFAPSPSCTPSRGALLTGQHPVRLGTAANLWSRWPGTEPEYPALLRQAGYHVGSVGKGWGPGAHPGQEHNPAGRRYSSLSAFFDRRPRRQPFALWLGSTHPHRPFPEGSGRRAGVSPEDVRLLPHWPDDPVVRSDVADYLASVQRFDQQVGGLLERLEAADELHDTLIVVTSDNGMPFPRAKANLYDAGVRVPLVMSWPRRIRRDGRRTELVSLVDLAPTLLEAAGLETPVQMTGQSLWPLLEGDSVPNPDGIVLARERHLPAQERPDRGGYPMRALRSEEYLLIRNETPQRWPAGTPYPEEATLPGAWLADCDDGPTKNWLWRHRDTAGVASFYDLAFAKRPPRELYELKSDPDQLINLAEDAAYREVLARLEATLDAALDQLRDPRRRGDASVFESAEYLGAAPQAADQVPPTGQP